jgi:SAM-dependent methyltransferase
MGDGALEVNKDVFDFWSKESLKHIKPGRGGEFPEGWDVRQFFQDLFTPEEYGSIVEVGCGYGRLCKAFHVDHYLGIDFSTEAVQAAKKLNPSYNFSTIGNTSKYPISNTKLLFTVLLHQADEDIEKIVANLATTHRIIVGEVCGRHWRRSGNPPVFNRDTSEYVDLFASFNKQLSKHIKRPYLAYNNTEIDIMVFT